MSPDRTKAVEVLAARCDAEPGAVVSELLARLRKRSDDLVRILAGESLRLEIALTTWTVHEAWIVFSPLGNVVAVTRREMLGCDRMPHVLFRGRPADILAVALGVTPVEQAVARGTFIPLVPVARFTGLLGLVAQDLLAIADLEAA